MPGAWGRLRVSVWVGACGGQAVAAVGIEMCVAPQGAFSSGAFTGQSAQGSDGGAQFWERWSVSQSVNKPSQWTWGQW